MTSSEHPKLLFVDDEPAFLAAIRANFRGRYRLTTAESGLEALEALLRDGPFPVIVTDLRMPGMDGIRLLEEVRLHSPETVAILLTGNADLRSAVDAVNLGRVFQFLEKPCHPRELRESIERALTQYRLVTADLSLLRREAQALNARAMRMERLCNLGLLARGVGHELKNVGNVLGMLMETLSEPPQSDEPIDDECLEDLRWIYEQLCTHGQNLMALGRPPDDTVERVDLRVLVSSTLRMLQSTGKTKYVDLATQLPTRAVMYDIRASAFEQLLVNLVSNAVDEVQQGSSDRRIKVSLEEDASTIKLAVRDHGAGVPPDLVDRIFEPYFTTKAPDQGTGLGLAVVTRIVEDHHGRLELDSEPGEGSEFRVLLPRKTPQHSQLAAGLLQGPAPPARPS